MSKSISIVAMEFVFDGGFSVFSGQLPGRRVRLLLRRRGRELAFGAPPAGVTDDGRFTSAGFLVSF